MNLQANDTRTMSPQVQAYCTAARQIAALADAQIRLLDRDAVPARFEELSDIARTIARFGTAAVQQEFYDLLATEPDVAPHAAADILQHFEPPEEIQKRAFSIIAGLPFYD